MKKVKENNSIEILKKLDKGMFCNIALPLTNSMKSNVTAIYLGRDKDKRYNFYDGGGACGTFKLTDKFIREKNIEITKQFNEEKTFDLYNELNKNVDREKYKDKNCR